MLMCILYLFSYYILHNLTILQRQMKISVHKKVDILYEKLSVLRKYIYIYIFFFVKYV